MATNRKAAKGASGGRPRSYSELYRNSRETVTAGEATKSTPSSSGTVAMSRRSEHIDWRTEYSHVFGDLRRLGAVSAVLVLAMIVAGFFLR